MKLNSPLLLLALPLWLASCTSSMDLIGERALESDEFYLGSGEAHVGDDALEAARQQQLLDQYGQYTESDYDSPYAGQVGSGQNGQLWNRYTGGFNSPFSPFGNTGFGYSPYANYGFGTPYGFSGSPYSPFNAGYASTYGYNNFAFNTGYDAWGNPIGGFGNPYGFGPGWGYDPWGGGYWGTPGFGYAGGYGYGYHPYYGTLGAYGNPYWGGFCGTADVNGGVSTFTPPRPRPSFGQFTGMAGSHGAGPDSGADDAGNGQPNVQTGDARPDAQRGQVGTRSSQRNRGVTTLPSQRVPNYGSQSPDRSGETEPTRIEPDRNRSNRNSGRSNGGWNAPAPSTPRGGGSFSQPSAPRPSSPRPSAPRSSGGRSGRGG